MARARLAGRAQDLAIQAVFVAAVALLIWGATSSASRNLADLGVSSGFDFLDRVTGWSYSFSLIERSIDDSYARTLFIGFLNTLFLGAISIVLATVLGFAVGTLRDARNLAARSAAAIFVQIFRNIPLILQLVFWYAVLIHMPGPRQAMSMLDLAFVSNRGVMLPVLNTDVSVAAALVGFAAVLGVALAFVTRWSRGRRLGVWALGVAVVALVATAATAPAGEGLVSVPELKGLRFVGGVTVSVELVAMVIAIVLYGAAYIAEVVRGGLQEVPRGLVEAGRALGLSPQAIWLNIQMPMALRTIIPPLGNQWIFLMKATTIGVAIGFSDLFYIVSTSITQSGQTLELIGILMAAFLAINFAIAQAVNLLNARLKLVGH